MVDWTNDEIGELRDIIERYERALETALDLFKDILKNPQGNVKFTTERIASVCTKIGKELSANKTPQHTMGGNPIAEDGSLWVNHYHTKK